MLATSVSEQAREEAIMQDVLRQFEETWRLYEATVTTAEEKALVSAFRSAWAKYQDKSGRLIALSRNDKKTTAANLLTGSLRDDFSRVRTALEDALAFNVAEGRKEADRAPRFMTRPGSW